MAYTPANNNGQATMANSAPVVIASDQAAVPVSDNGGSLTVDGTVAVSNFPATQPVSGPLTDTQLRATAVPISGTVTANAGTGTMNVSVQNASIPVTGSFFQATQPVSGPLTDTQLRATAVPISGTVSTGLTQPLTDTQLRATAVPVSGPLTDAQIRATALPVSGTVTADTELPAAAALADAVANPTTPLIGGAMSAFNGTTWDRLKTDTALAGNAANDSVLGILAVGTGPGYAVRLNPANLGTAANSASTFNVDGANSVTIAISTTTTGTFIIEGTADNTTFIALEVFDGSQDLWVSGQNITPTAGKVYQVMSQGYRQIRLRTVTTLGATVAHAITLSNAQQFLGGIDTGAAPHNFGYTLVHRDAEYTTAQTGAALWTPTTGKRFAVTDITISTGGTTAGIVTLWQGAAADTTYTTGTDPVIFRGEFAPSATVKPGAVKSFNVPFVSTTVDHILRVTTSAAMTVYVQLNGYEI